MFRLLNPAQVDEDNDIPIALVDGDTKKRGYWLVLSKDGDTNIENTDEDMARIQMDILTLTSEYAKMSEVDKKQMRNAIHINVPPKEPFKKRLYEITKELAEEADGKEFNIGDGFLVPIPHPTEDSNQRIYVSGASNSGKSTWINKFCRIFAKLYPNCNIYVFSSLDSDKNLEEKLGSKLHRIKLDQKWLDDPEYQDVSLLRNQKGGYSVCIFDDIDSISDKALLKAVQHYRDRALEVGRHDKLQVITVSHEIMNWKATRKSISEATDIVVFPGGGNSSQISNFMKTYMGMNKSEIARILKAKSRWVMVSKTRPKYVLSENEAYLLN